MISIILTQYKHEAYLPEAVASILNQTYQDWELLIMNDDPGADLWYYQGIDPRIFVCECTKNEGQGAKINEGIKLAKGEFIAMQDADDISFPYRLKLCLDFLTVNDLDLIYTDMIALDNYQNRSYVSVNDWKLENILNFSVGAEGTMFWRKSLDTPIWRDCYGQGDLWQLELYHRKAKVGRLPLATYMYRTYTTSQNLRKRFKLRWNRHLLRKELQALNRRLSSENI